MKTLLILLFSLFFIHTNAAFTQQESSVSTYDSVDMLCSPNKDTLFIVPGPTTAVILEVWDMPQNKNDKPVFVYVSKERIDQMAVMPRYARKPYNSNN